MGTKKMANQTDTIKSRKVWYAACKSSKLDKTGIIQVRNLAKIGVSHLHDDDGKPIEAAVEFMQALDDRKKVLAIASDKKSVTCVSRILKDAKIDVDEMRSLVRHAQPCTKEAVEDIWRIGDALTQAKAAVNAVKDAFKEAGESVSHADGWRAWCRCEENGLGFGHRNAARYIVALKNLKKKFKTIDAIPTDRDELKDCTLGNLSIDRSNPDVVEAIEKAEKKKFTYKTVVNKKGDGTHESIEIGSNELGECRVRACFSDPRLMAKKAEDVLADAFDDSLEHIKEAWVNSVPESE